MSSTQTNIRLEVIPNVAENPERARELATLYLTEMDELETVAEEPIEETAAQELIKNKIADMKDETIVAAIDGDGQVVAMAGLKHMMGTPEGVVMDVATASEHQRKGLGARVMNEITSIAKQEGLSHLHVFPSHKSGLFYRNLGFSYQPTKSPNPSWGTKNL